MPTLTVKIAAGGTTIDSNGSSLAGHMWLSIICLLLMTLSGCAVLNPTMPVEIPIDLSKAGSVAEAEFWIPQDDRIKLTLYFFNDQPANSKRLYELVGGFGKPGKTIPLKIQIKKLLSSEKEVDLLEIIDFTDGLRGVANGSEFIIRTVDKLSIKSGSYRLRVENIQSIPEFAQNRVEFRAYYIRYK